MPGSSIDWDKIKADYITSENSYRDLARKYGLSVSIVQQRGRAGGWVKLRQDYRKKAAAKGIKKAMTKDSESLSRLMVSIDKLVKQVSRGLDDSAQMHRHILRDADGEENEKILARVDWQAVRMAASALKDLTATARDLLGIRTAVEEDASALAWAKLELEKQKFAAGGPDDDESTGVVILSPVDNPENGSAETLETLEASDDEQTSCKE